MMAMTYDSTTELKREWLRQVCLKDFSNILKPLAFIPIYFKWAKQVLTLEQSIRAVSKKRKQLKYSCSLSNGQNAFMVRRRQTVKIF